MKKFVPFIFLLLLTSCFNRIVTTYEKPKGNMTSDSCNPRIVTQKDLFGLSVNYLGSIKIDEPFTYLTRASCSKEVAFKRLKLDACNLNANLINFSSEINPGEVIPPYHRSPCYRCMADYYYIKFDSLNNKILNQDNREIIYYRTDQKLSWADFKVKLPESSEKPYEFISTLQLKSGSMSVWTGAFKDFEAVGMFYSDVSKVKSSFASSSNEKITNLLFKLTQMYANNLEEKLNSTKPRIADRNKIQNIVEEYLKNMNLEIENFNNETEFGKNNIAFDKWENRINAEINKHEIKK